MSRNIHRVSVPLLNHIIEHLDLEDFLNHVSNLVAESGIMTLEDISYLDSKIQIKLNIPNTLSSSQYVGIDKTIVRIVELYFL